MLDGKIIQKENVFFDGGCGFCNFWVRFLSRLDEGQKYSFYPLKSEHAKELLQNPPSKNRSVIFQKGESIYIKSEAVIRILHGLGGIYRFAKILYLIPRPFRDYLYDKVAQNRHKLTWFDDKSCKIN